jgi:translocation and assembly module TamB
MRKRLAGSTILVLAAILAAATALAQERSEKSAFVRFLETMLSTPERQVSLDGVEGVFSAAPRVEKITIADSGGAWLELEGVEVSWNRSALLSRTLDIETLSARRVALLRTPAAAKSSESQSPFRGPPVNINVASFSFPDVTLAEAVAGAEAQLTGAGSARVTAEAVAVQLSVDRQDRAGRLVADLRLEPEANVLSADLTLEEPANGLLAEMLDLNGRPPVAIALSGAGPLDEWRATLSMDAGGARVLAGDVTISSVEGGYRVVADATAALETLAPQDYAALFAGESRLALDATRGVDGAIGVQSATLRSGGVDLAASGRLTSDLVPENAEFSLRLGDAGRAALPFAPGDMSVAGLQVTAGLDGGATAPWTLAIAAAGVESVHGRADALNFSARGQASQLASAANRRTTFRTEGAAEGLAFADPELQDAIGTTLQLTGAGSWSAGLPIAFDSLQVVLSGATASFAGMATGAQLVGNFEATLVDLARFEALAGRPLGGSASLQASGTAGFSGDFDLRLQGEADDLALGIPSLDPLLGGTTRLQGGVVRERDRLQFDGLLLQNARITAELNGALADELDLAVSASIADLASLTPRAAGGASISARLTGVRAAPHLEAEASGDEVVLMGRPLSDAAARFSGIVAGPETSGELQLSGSLGGAPVSGAGRLAAGEGGGRRIDSLVLSVGESRLSGDLALVEGGLLSGNVEVVSPDLSEVAPLFLVEAGGMLRAEIALGAAGGAQSAVVSATATDVVYEDVTLDSAEIEGEGRNLFTLPEIAGDFAIRNLRTGGLVVVRADGRAERQGQSTLLNVDAQLADGRATLTGSLEPRANGVAIALQDFGYSRPGIDLTLAAPSTVIVENGTASFDSARLNAGGGTAIVSGRAGADLDLDVELSSVPAELVNAFRPGLGAEGTISGTIFVSGTAAAPAAEFNIALADASMAASRNAGLGPLSVSTQGNLANDVVRIASRVSGADGLAVQVAGTAGTTSGAAIDLKVTGVVPLGLGNRQLADRGAALQGALDLDVTISGSAAAPQFSGRVTSEGGGFVDPDTGIVLRDISLAASISNNRLVVDRLSAASGEGSVTAVGSIGLDPNAGFPIDLKLQVRQARYVDGTLVAARFDADLALTGSFAAGPVLEGTVLLDRTEITVPEQLPRDSVAVDVAHVAPPPPVQQTLAAVRNPEGRGSAGSRSSGMNLNLVISAPRQIFVRGRGLDAELGGDLRLTGPISAIVAAGAFDMVRGRLDILTQRIAFDRGIITFAGDLDPILDFVGTTQSGDVTISVTVSGRASDPEVLFSSIPELPQDEVLARLIFQKGLGELSPVQIARLAAVAAELSGGSGGLLGQLRESTGLDDLDIVMDEEGAPSLAAGRYVSENVYIGVQQGTTAESSRVTIDLDITEDVKARAGVSASGGSSLGIFFEREY